jgi:hypothetical protein
MTRIVAAAVRTIDGLIHTMPRPHRHHHIVHAMHRPDNTKENDLIIAEGEQGFITDDGEFVERVMAANLAVEAGQIRREKLIAPPRLYSEDLW